ncbi:MAG: HAMP domain-containing sensor histidine kinase [Methylotenera sp.]|uniref:HAMP domain-containing sensor histidine kinase n=1 Tax=Methylotenera sp. TaxID=2051956 RepID=UPI00248886B2|nr:HAMP domain-containing sensor histidine kinase [Methylotenera sp.]MDI1308583.1 HAMP domain-containing sensor histidine kinase [Methylotenera sp.]
MRFQYPSSFLKLLLIGFAFAIVPLLWVFANANIAFDNLAKQSQITISNAVVTTRSGRVLQEQLNLMERSSKQYFVLQDNVLFNNYTQAHIKFNDAISQLETLANTPSQHKNLQLLSVKTSQLHDAILSSKQINGADLGFLHNYSEITQLVETIVQENNLAIDAASSQLTLTVQHTQKKLFLQSLVLIPLALLVAGAITYLLARPIKRMDAAIRHLGKGEYDQPIAIDGPGDLRILGQRLDWLRNELKEVDEQKQQFLRHVSHELKTPLTAIREATELLYDGIGGALSAQQSEITLILRENSIRLQRMIENLLNYTRMESIEAKLTLEKVDLFLVINKVIHAHALSIRNKELIVETNYNVKTVVADEEKLTIILDNLISNAVKYTPQQGLISVQTRLEKDSWLIEVQDNGPGLAELDQAQLFDPFYRGNTLHQSLIGSSGLGLTIAKDLVNAHQGVIKLTESDQGAHFIVSIPQLEIK